jgi:MFS family permease
MAADDAARWTALAASMLVESVSGSAYAFSVYSPQIKAHLNYTQAELNNVGGLGDLGLYFSFVAGFAFDTWGPTATAVGGAAISAVGYTLLYLTATGRITTAPGAAAAWAAVAWHGSGWLDTMAVATNVRNFGANKGLVLGLVKALFGLSASLLSLGYACLFRPDVNAFLLFLTVLIPAVTLPLAPLFRLLPPEDVAPLTPREASKISAGYGLTLVTVGYLITVSLLQGRGLLGTSWGWVAALVPLVGGHALLAVRVGKGGGGGGKAVDGGDGSAAEADSVAFAGTSSSGGGDEATMRQSLLTQQQEEVEEGGADGAAAHPSAAHSTVVEGATFWQGVCTGDYALILVLLFSATGAGLVTINNLGNLVQSLGAATDGQDVYVSLLSVANCGGRIFYGWVSDSLAHRLTRPWWLALLVAQMAASQALLAFSSLGGGALYLGVMATGFTYGGFWSLGPSLVAERYGPRAFASIYSVTSLTTAVASYALNAGLAAGVYQAHTPPGATTCTVGIACFQTTFLTLAGLNVAGAAVAAWLAVRMRRFYDPATGRALPYHVIAADLAASSGGGNDGDDGDDDAAKAARGGLVVAVASGFVGR